MPVICIELAERLSTKTSLYSYRMATWIGVLHFLGLVFVSLYFVWVPTPSMMDYVYLYYTILVVFHWTLFGSQCSLTQWLIGGRGKQNDLHVFPFGRTFNDGIVQLVYCIWMYSIYQVFMRQGFPVWLPALFISTYFVYQVAIHTVRSLQMVESILFYVLLFVLGATIYYTMCSTYAVAE